MNPALLTSNKHDWGTPPELFKRFDDEFHFTLDVCAIPENAKCPRFFTPADDGLSQSWKGERVWMNPPYGFEIRYWMNKAHREVGNGCKLAVCLVPSRTDTEWWHRYAMKGEIRFLKGRFSFYQNGKPAGRCPFPCAVVIFHCSYVADPYNPEG